MYENDQYDTAVKAVELRPSTVSLKQEMQHELDRAKANVNRLERLNKLLDENPNITEILQLLGRKY